LFEDLVRSGIAKITYRHVITRGQVSIQSALAAECAADQGAFWLFHDQLFKHRFMGTGVATRSIDQHMMQIAADIGLSTNTFNDCFNDEIHLPRITADERLAVELGVHSMPAIFVNDVATPAFPANLIIAAVLEVKSNK
jgi:protein-disulfide isomerase